MSVQHIISEALIEYDTAQPVIRYLKKRGIIEGFKTTSDTERSRFKFVSDDGEVILDTEVELLGVFYDKFDVWSWAWSLTGLTNAEIYLSKKILLHGLEMSSDTAYIRSILTTSRGIIKDITQIDINLAVGASFIKQPYIFPFIYHINDNDLVYYFILLNKKDLDKLGREISNLGNDDENIE